ncbi:Endoplasmic reticulum oxidoreductin 1 [Arabidopsis suecica]|uniref:Endoplasmic reticulum oxidoreductin 1 n=1 Tax=Arabidopsis suecica TaxID=45249 RepID=A0A8T1ZUJ3_ARASU|nr:Endoplasmic reticulum oxidoreductin 1 [Arabidopsis suecica]
MIEDCCCDYEIVDNLNNEFLNPLLQRSRHNTIFSVKLWCDCPFWPDDGMCRLRDCSVCECPENEFPEPFKKPFVPGLSSDVFTCQEGKPQGAVDRTIDNRVFRDLSGETCPEKKVLYKLISGLHSSISMHIAAEYLLDESRNQFYSPKLQTACPVPFDEAKLWQGQRGPELKQQIEKQFRNISALMDCVACQKCRLWEKLQVQGLGTSLKILFSAVNQDFGDHHTLQLQRNEVIALVNLLNHLSESVKMVHDMGPDVEDQIAKVSAKPGRLRRIWDLAVSLHVVSYTTN